MANKETSEQATPRYPKQYVRVGVAGYKGNVDVIPDPVAETMIIGIPVGNKARKGPSENK